MISKFTRDIIQSEIADFFAGVVEIHTELGGPNTVEEAQNQLTERVLACVPAVDSEPVAWTDEQELRDVDRGGCGYLFTVNPVTRHADERRIILLYRHAQPASEREQVRREHAEWSQATFGNVGPVGPLKHLSKEALEAAAEPDDLSEWADMQFLLWDAQRRAGITDEQITQAMIEKLAVNKLRDWPEPKDGEPRLHIKEQPALVIPDVISLEKVAEMTAARGAEYSIRDGIIAAKWWNACRAAMLAAAPHDTPALNSLQSVDSVADRWIPVSERIPDVGDIVLTAMVGSVNVGEMERSGANYRYFTSVISGRELPATHWMPLPAAPQEPKS